MLEALPVGEEKDRFKADHKSREWKNYEGGAEVKYLGLGDVWKDLGLSKFDVNPDVELEDYSWREYEQALQEASPADILDVVNFILNR